MRSRNRWRPPTPPLAALVRKTPLVAPPAVCWQRQQRPERSQPAHQQNTVMVPQTAMVSCEEGRALDGTRPPWSVHRRCCSEPVNMCRTRSSLIVYEEFESKMDWLYSGCVTAAHFPCRGKQDNQCSDCSDDTMTLVLMSSWEYNAACLSTCYPASSNSTCVLFSQIRTTSTTPPHNSNQQQRKAQLSAAITFTFSGADEAD